MRVLISAFGSYGDVHPMVGIGTEMARRGHRVSILTNPYFTEVVEQAGLELVPISTVERYTTLTQHPDLWHPTKSVPLVMREAMLAGMREAYDAFGQHVEPGNTIIVSHGLDLGGKLYAEQQHIPCVAATFAPVSLWSDHHPPTFVGTLTGPKYPRWLNRLQFWIGEHLVIRPILWKELQAFRGELGLPPLRSVYPDLWHRADYNFCLFPKWFAPPQPDWPSNVTQFGFPLWDAHRDATLSPELEDFLAAGDAPIVFTPGSAMRDGSKFFRAAVEACTSLGRRGILLTKYAEQLPPQLPTAVRHFGFVPLSLVLPRAAAFVHHAGIGSCAQGLSAGIPQVVQPMAFDQLDNADRLRRLGVAEILPPKKFTGPNLTAALDCLLDNPKVAKDCTAAAAKCREDHGLQRLGDALEKFAADCFSTNVTVHAST